MKRPLGRRDVGGWIILKYNLRKSGGLLWIGFTCLWMRNSDGFAWMWQWTFCLTVGFQRRTLTVRNWRFRSPVTSEWQPVDAWYIDTNLMSARKQRRVSPVRLPVFAEKWKRTTVFDHVSACVVFIANNL